jgi:hypothetical protein
VFVCRAVSDTTYCGILIVYSREAQFSLIEGDRLPPDFGQTIVYVLMRLVAIYVRREECILIVTIGNCTSYRRARDSI